MKMKNVLFWVSLLVQTAAASAAGPQWTWDAGVQTNNGAITVKSLTGSNTYSATQNPTGAVVKMNQNAVTQPPTIVIQATATLPIKSEGDSCSQITGGTFPNQTADEGIAVTSNRSLLLSCQSGAWLAAAGGNSFGGSFITMNTSVCVLANTLTGTCSCPTGYDPYPTSYFAQSGQLYHTWQCQKNVGT